MTKAHEIKIYARVRHLTDDALGTVSDIRESHHGKDFEKDVFVVFDVEQEDRRSLKIARCGMSELEATGAVLELEQFDGDPDGDEDRAGDGWYYKLPGAESWSGAWHSEDEALREAALDFVIEATPPAPEVKSPGPFNTLSDDADRIQAIRAMIARNKPLTREKGGMGHSWSNHPIDASVMQWVLDNPQALNIGQPGDSFFYLAKLTNKDGEHLASREVWGWSRLADKANVAADAAKEFERDMEDVEGNVILIYGPFNVNQHKPEAFAMTAPGEEMIATACDIPPECGWPNED